MSSGDELIAREDKLKELRRIGIEAYGRRFLRTHSVEELRNDFEKLVLLDVGSNELGQRRGLGSCCRARPNARGQDEREASERLRKDSSQ